MRFSINLSRNFFQQNNAFDSFVQAFIEKLKQNNYIWGCVFRGEIKSFSEEQMISQLALWAPPN